MDFILTIIFFFLILGFLVFIHELGHFLAAKFVGVHVIEFAIGFGKSLISKEYKGTVYKLNLIPMGGYVQLEGEEKNTGPNSFRAKPFWAKAIILVAGVTMNIVFAILFLGFFLATNNYKFSISNYGNFNFSYVDNVKSYLPAVVIESKNSNLAPNTTIVAVNNKKLESSDEFFDLVYKSADKPIKFTLFDFSTFEEKTLESKLDILENNYFPVTITSVLSGGRSEGILEEGDRLIGFNNIFFKNTTEFYETLNSLQGQKVTLHILSKNNTESVKEMQLGVRSDKGTILDVKLGFPEVKDISVGFESKSPNGAYFIQYKNNPLSAFAITWDLTLYQFTALGNMFSDAFKTGNYEQVSQSVGGLPALGSQVKQVVDVGAFEVLIPLTALVSLSLAIVNILPFPALDGGQLLIAAIEAATKRKLPDELVNRINFSGFVFLIILFILVTIKDINQLGWVSSLGNLFNSILGR